MLKSRRREILSTQPLRSWLIEIVDTFYDCLEDLEPNVLFKLSEPGPYLREGEDEEGLEGMSFASPMFSNGLNALVTSSSACERSASYSLKRAEGST
jgi:hypothetical protein